MKTILTRDIASKCPLNCKREKPNFSFFYLSSLTDKRDFPTLLPYCLRRVS